MTYVALALLAALVAVIVLYSRQRNALDRAEAGSLQMQQERERVVDFMHLMVEALGEGLGPQELRQRIVHASILCSGALSACLFERTDRGTMQAAAVEGLFPPHRPIAPPADGKASTRARFIEQVLKAEEFPVGDGIVGRVAQTGRGELLADATADPRIVKHTDPALKVRSVIAVPLAFREKFFGVLAVTNPADDQPFEEADFTLIQSLAEQAALALHNAEFLDLLLQRRQLDLDLSIASGIQKMLLPREAPTLEGLDLDARYTPAQRVGGDLYDIIPLSATRLAVVVADVAGKGIAASMLMAICRTNLHQIAMRHDSPVAVLSELNKALSEDVEAGLYVTMLYAVIDTEANTVSFARAGHELPLIVRGGPGAGTCRAEYVPSDGMALGMVPSEVFDLSLAERVEPFAPGDTLVLYTDGITEAPNEDGKEFAGARLADTVRMLHGRSAAAVNDGILEAVGRFAGSESQRDDLTLVTVRRLPQSN
jgi:sigma-B regulation protein RsbU (phosphoserine phosphatase)